MFKKIVMIAMVFGLIAMAGNICLAATDDNKVTEGKKVVCSNNMQFAEFLAQKYGVSIPDTTPPRGWNRKPFAE